MRKLKEIKKLKNEAGFTLIEVLSVLVILGVIAAIAVPSVYGIIENSKREVCYVNQAEIERMYEDYLVLEELEHSDQRFTNYLRDNHLNESNDHGEYSYIDGKVHCSIHSDNELPEVEVPDIPEVPEDNEGGSVPFL
ncbi:hypothetical protein GCM10011351_17740 [Paraliobacillus quinghaiensis]|uniref:Prepilin-type N-terminal cleavage/methylation domain-containing protein n=1 Tax=Paraliobacillus quinghaiensis TaxID=470815 RepID=A0A917WTX8_9BACI|nr:type II secretion system protein [Paraliobacillus quinghaiensis]GGM32017.1 hypothetical protein GCM10011351_17740 [Paraliobacillus quinghaiensis]